MELPYDPAIPLPGIYPKETKSLSWRDSSIPKFIGVLFTLAKVWKQSKCPKTDEWIKKMWCFYVYKMEFYSALKEKEIMSFTKTWMKLEGIKLSEKSQTKKNKYCMVSKKKKVKFRNWREKWLPGAGRNRGR